WPNWQEPAQMLEAAPLDVFVLLNQAYFMGMFFLLSGYFVPGSADRNGERSFVIDRLRRLGIPLLAFLLLLRPLYTLPRYLGLPAAERPPYGEFYLTSTDIGPIWFLAVLLGLSLVYAVVRRWRGTPAAASQTSVRAWQIIAFAIALASVSYLWRIIVPNGSIVLGIPSAAYLPQYIVLFIVGILAARRGWLTALPRRSGMLGAALIVVSFLPMVLGGYETLGVGVAVPAPGAPAHLAFALWDQLFAVGMILVLLTIFRRRVTTGGSFSQFLAGSAYAVYLVHAPIIVGFVALLVPLAPSPLSGFAVTLPLSLVASWVVAAWLRRLPWARSIL
ncbi:MAG TPA: acyltransferase, partial [Microbacterium sp.]|nr:acyltransferase [Microbacterium sp.]